MMRTGARERRHTDAIDFVGTRVTSGEDAFVQAVGPIRGSMLAANEIGPVASGSTVTATLTAPIPPTAVENATYLISQSAPTVPASSANLPLYWARQTDDSIYVFFAHPQARDVRYPMQYGQSYCSETVTREVVLHVGGTAKKIRLAFDPYQSLAMRIDRTNGDIEFEDIKHIPPAPAREV